jgi:hypothetical protein
MTPSDTSNDDIDTEAAFNDALRELLVEAHESGLDVEGGWECRTSEGAPDWDVVVSEVETLAASDGGE